MSGIKYDYYWRDYFGEIPEDAVHGGHDQKMEKTFIGQVFILNHGLLPVRIYNGEKFVTASKDGIYKTSDAIKILCSFQKEKFVWMETTASTLHTDTIGKHLVVGGFENGNVLNLGRIAYQEEVIVGKVCAYDSGKGILFFPYKDKELSKESYEVLIYDNDAVADIDVR